MGELTSHVDLMPVVFSDLPPDSANEKQQTDGRQKTRAAVGAYQKLTHDQKPSWCVPTRQGTEPTPAD